MDHGQLGAAGTKFVALDLDGRLAWPTLDYPTGDFQLHAAVVVQHRRPVYSEPDLLAFLERMLRGEPDFAAADFKRLADTHKGYPATSNALIAYVLFYRKPASRAPPVTLAWNVVHGCH